MRLLTNSTVVALSLFSLVYADVDVSNQPTDQPYRITARHVEPQGIGYKEGYTTLEGFFCLYEGWDHWIFFLDTRGHVFNNGKPAMNAGLGARYLTSQRIWGINSYYDYRNTKHQHYNQVALGFESLGHIWDFRLNGYLPVGKKQSPNYDLEFDRFEGHQALIRQKYEYALAGLNAEGGAHVNCLEKLSLYLAAGPYYLTGKGSSTWGGQFRASIRMLDYVKIEGNVSYDHLFKWVGQGQLGLCFSFGGKKARLKQQSNSCNTPCILTERSYLPVERFEIIPVDKKYKKSAAIDPNTGLPYHFVFVDNMSSSLGTYESPYHSLATAEAASNPYDIIYVFPGDGTTTHMDHGITLKPNQKLWGSANQHNLSTTVGSAIIPEMSSSAPQITNIDLLAVGATLSTNNEISGITFIETSGQAIFGVDPVTVNLSSCVFSACGQGDLGLFPIVLQTSSPLNATIDYNLFTNNPNAGTLVKLLPGALSAQITMNNNQAYGNQATSGGGAMMNLEAHGSVGVCNLVMMNNNFQNNNCGAVNITDFDSPHEGSFNSFSGSIIGNTFIENTQGITFGTNADQCTLRIQDNNLSSNTNGSILITAGAAGTQAINNGSILIDSNQINQGGNGGDAITISPAGDLLSIEMTNNSIMNNTGTGLVSFLINPVLIQHSFYPTTSSPTI
jgi:hypothetical protein